MKHNKRALLVTLLTSLIATGALLSQTQAAPPTPMKQLQMQPHTAIPVGPGSIGTLQISCAKGFNKKKHTKDNQGATTQLKCETPIIKCPKSPKYAGLIVKPEAVKVGGGFRFSYSCTYFDPPK